jgi:hypothetical protein
MVCLGKLAGENYMDGTDTLSLGTETAPWMIKDFSVTLRQAITRAARAQGVTVAEFVHTHFARFGVDGVVVEPRQTSPKQTTPDPAIEDLCRLAEAAARLAEYREKMPRGLASALARRLRDALRQEASASSPKMLAAPEA